MHHCYSTIWLRSQYCSTEKKLDSGYVCADHLYPDLQVVRTARWSSVVASRDPTGWVSTMVAEAADNIAGEEAAGTRSDWVSPGGRCLMSDHDLLIYGGGHYDHYGHCGRCGRIYHPVYHPIYLLIYHLCCFFICPCLFYRFSKFLPLLIQFLYFSSCLNI
jgi:hypothetical protein